MNKLIQNIIHAIAVREKGLLFMAFSAVFLMGCGGATMAPKPRKKLPEFSSFSDFNNSLSTSQNSEHYPGLPFGGSDLEFFANGKFNSYTYIAINDMESDSLVMNLVNTYKPFAIPMLSEWSRNYKKGVLIDFRPKPGASYSSTEFNMESTGSFSFPVVFIYDGNSASRASWFMGNLKGFSALKISAINNGITSKSGSLNCF